MADKQAFRLYDTPHAENHQRYPVLPHGSSPCLALLCAHVKVARCPQLAKWLVDGYRGQRHTRQMHGALLAAYCLNQPPRQALYDAVPCQEEELPE